MSCPNCGAHVGETVTLSDEKIAPVRPSRVWLSRDVYRLERCEGLDDIDGHGRMLSDPCGWFRWAHERRAAYGVRLP